MEKRMSEGKDDNKTIIFNVGSWSGRGGRAGVTDHQDELKHNNDEEEEKQKDDEVGGENFEFLKSYSNTEFIKWRWFSSTELNKADLQKTTSAVTFSS